MSQLTHVDATGQANMVDVNDKLDSVRTASAEGRIYMSRDTIVAITSNQNKKGDVLSTAKIAGIMGAKKCSELIPLCHPLMLSKIDVTIDIHEPDAYLLVQATCKLTGKTGVEMEALTAVNIALLTLFDMCKASDPGMLISDIKVIHKTGGKNGEWRNLA